MINSFYNIYSFSRMIKDKCISYLYEEPFTSPERLYDLPNSYINNIYNLTYQPTEIIPRLYLGNAYNASNFETLSTLNIGQILNITNEIPIYFPNYFNYIQCEIRDIHNSHLLSHLDYLADTIHLHLSQSNTSSFVHCFMGSSRSASVIIAYLIKYHSYELDNAIQFIKDKRPIINLNKSFYLNLQEFQQKIKKNPSSTQQD